jgi:type IV pilus assembly protein PilM
MIQMFKSSKLNLPTIPPNVKELLSKILKKPAQTNIPQLPRLVCDYGKSKIVFLEVEKTDAGLKLLKFQKTQRASDPEKDVEVLKQAYESGGYSNPKIRISVKGQGVILRFIQFPQMKLPELRSAISFEIDQYIPFKAHEVIWDVHILDESVPMGSGTGMNVLLVAVKRDDLYSMIQVIQKAGLEIEFIDVDALAAINALEFFNPEAYKNPVAILDIGTEISTLSICQNGKPRFIRDISYGGLDVLKRLKRKLGLTHEQALQQIEVDRVPTPETAAVLKEGLADLVSDLKLSFNYYQDQVQSAESIKTLFIAGGGGYHPIVIETLKNDLGLPTEIMDIQHKIEVGPGLDAEFVKRNAGLLVVSMGLALRDL